MYEGGQNTGYRIKKRKNNYMSGEEPHGGEEEDQYKISIHSSSQMSPNKSRKLSQGIRYRNTRMDRSSHRRPPSSKNLANSSITTATNKTKTKPADKIKQFDNVKWLAIISAYDPKQLKNITTSSTSYQKFLKSGDVRKDPYSKDTYRVVIEHFKCWVVRIRNGYFQILNKFLAQNTNISAIVTLAAVKPLLQQVKFEASMMHEKVKCCKQTKNYRQFSGLLLKFDSFLEASQQIEQIIYIVNQSKNNIDDLFQNLQKDKQIDKKVDRQRRKGIKKARKAVKDYGDDGIEGKILEKVQNAINQMANKTLEAFSKINGARGLMLRIKDCLADRRQFYELQTIIVINEIFREVLKQADDFQKFSDRFMDEGDILNDDLKQCILKYKQEVLIKKQAVETMQLKFISDIIQSAIQIMQANYSVCNAVDSVFCDEYRRIQKLLTSICQIITDETKKVHVDLMLKDNKQKVRKLEYLKNKLSKVNKNVMIDQETGLNQLLAIEDAITNYKKLIRTIVQRQERTFRQLNTNFLGKNKRGRWQQFPDNDPEEDYLKLLIKLSKQMNNTERKHQIHELPGIRSTDNLYTRTFKDINENDIGEDKIKIINWTSNTYKQYQQLVSNNQLSTIISAINIYEELYESSVQILQMYKIVARTQETTLLVQAEKLSKEASGLNNKISINFLDRCIYFMIYSGLEKRIIKSLQSPSESIVFPSTQHDIESLKRDIKYLNMIAHKLPSKKAIKYYKNRSESEFDEFSCNRRIDNLMQALKEIIEGVLVYENIKWNQSELYYLNSQTIIKTVMELFTQIFMSNSSEVSIISLDKCLSQVTNRLDGCLGKLKELEEKENISSAHKARINHIVSIIGEYYQINKKLWEQIGQIQTQTDKIKDQVGLKIYSQTLLSFSKYLHDTKQSCHITLNNEKNKSPIFISISSQKNDTNPLGAAIGLPTLKIGTSANKCENKACVPYTIKPEDIPKPMKNKDKNKEKKQNKNSDQINDQMQDYIEDEEMGDEIEDDMIDEMQDDMGEQIDDDMVDEMDDEMGEQIDDDMVDEMDDEMEEQISSQKFNDQVADQQFDFDEQILPKKKKSTKTETKKCEQPKQQQQYKQLKQESKQLTQQYQSVRIIPKKNRITYQILTCPIETLEQLFVIITKLNSLQKLYWGQIDYINIQQYYNRQYKGQQINQLLMTKLDAVCTKQFPKQIYANNKSLNALESYKNILRSIHNIDYYNMEELRMILGMIGLRFSQFVGIKGQFLCISIQNDKDKQSAQSGWNSNACIVNYVTKQLKQLQLDPQKQQNSFQFSQFTDKLLKSRSGVQYVYRIPKQWQLLQPKIQQHDLMHKIEQIRRCSAEYSSFYQYPDGMDLPATLMQLWVNVISPQHTGETREIKVKGKVYDDLKLLKEVLNQYNFIHYVSSLRIQSEQKYKKLHAHEKSITEILQGTSSQNIMQNITRLISIYQPESDTIIFLQDNTQPLFIKSFKAEDALKKLLFTILTPKKQMKANITMYHEIQQNIRQHPQYFLQYGGHIKKLLSVLSIESHIWASDTNLEIYGTRDQLVDAMIKQASLNVITNKEGLKKQAMKSLQESYSVINSEQMVWEYTCKDNTILDQTINSQYLKQLEQLRTRYIKQSKICANLEICIFQGLLQTNNQERTQEVLEQLDELESMLTDNIPRLTQKQSLFTYYQPYVNQVHSIGQKLSNARNKLEIIVEPIDFSNANSQKFIQDFQTRNQAIIQLYQQNQQNKHYHFGAVDICFCQDQCNPSQRARVFINKNSNSSALIQLLSLVFSDPKNIYSFIKMNIEISESPQDQRYVKVQTLHGGKMLNSIKNMLNYDMKQELTMFMNQFNYQHFIDPKNKTVEQSLQKLKQRVGKQQKIFMYASQLLMKTSKNNQMYQLMSASLVIQDSQDSMNKAQFKQEQLRLLTSLDLTHNRRYSDFGKLALEILNKIHHIQIIILMDKVDENNLVCMLPDPGNQQQLKAQLQRIKLPKQYDIIQSKKSYTKIQLKQQTIQFKLTSEISAEQLNYYKQQQYGLNGHNFVLNETKKTLLIGVYNHYLTTQNLNELEKDEVLLRTYEINGELLQNNQLQISLNQQQIHGELEFRIIETQIQEYNKYEPEDIEQYFKKIIKSEKINAFIGDEIQLVKLTKWFQRQIQQHQERKQAELQRKIQQQKRLKEAELRKIKAQQEQQRKKDEQERVEKLQKQKLQLEQKRRKQEQIQKNQDPNDYDDDGFDD